MRAAVLVDADLPAVPPTEAELIASLLARLPGVGRWCVEFGAWDGVVASNTAALVAQGWSAVLIEGDPAKFRSLEARYAARESVVTLCAMVGWEGPGTLDALLAGTPVPVDFDLLSVDIDGNDHHVWAAVRAYRPKLVVIEFNPTIANGVAFVQAADPAVHQGASLSSLVDLARTKGYELAAATELNAFFVRDDLFPALGITDNHVDVLRTDTSWLTQVFFGYDGQAVLLGGGKGLYWHGLAVPETVRLVPRPFVGWPGDFGPVRRHALTAWRAQHALRRAVRRFR